MGIDGDETCPELHPKNLRWIPKMMGFCLKVSRFKCGMIFGLSILNFRGPILLQYRQIREPLGVDSAPF